MHAVNIKNFDLIGSDLIITLNLDFECMPQTSLFGKILIKYNVL